MASSDSGFSCDEVMADAKEEASNGVCNRTANVVTPSESSTSDVTSPHTHRDVIMCGDCQQEFNISQFAIFLEHKVKNWEKFEFFEKNLIFLRFRGAMVSRRRRTMPLR